MLCAHLISAGAFIVADVLSPSECTALIQLAEAIGYERDGVDGIGAVVWLAPPSLLDPIFARVEALLPAILSGCILKGLNARLRFFRYKTGIYRPHIDGSWPGSGLDVDGNLTGECCNTLYRCHRRQIVSLKTDDVT